MRAQIVDNFTVTALALSPRFTAPALTVSTTAWLSAAHRLSTRATSSIATASVSLSPLREADFRKNPDGYNEWESAHRKFRLALISGCGMPMLLHFCGRLMDLYDRYLL